MGAMLFESNLFPYMKRGFWTKFIDMLQASEFLLILNFTSPILAIVVYILHSDSNELS